MRDSRYLLASAALFFTMGCASDTTAPAVTDPCAEETTSIGQTVSGTIGQASCVSKGARVASYGFQVTSETDLSYTGTGPTGAGWCFCLYDASGAFLAGNAQNYRLAPGKYSLVVNTHSDTAKGSFTISTAKGTPPTGGSPTLVVSRGVTIPGTLSSGDMPWFPAGGGLGTSNRADTYMLWLEAGQTITVSATSTAPVQLELRTFGSTISTTTALTAPSITYTTLARDYYQFLIVGTTGTYTFKLN